MDGNPIWSFDWVAADRVGGVRNAERIYSDLFPPELLTATAAMLLSKGEQQLMEVHRPSIDITVLVRARSTRCFTLSTSHRVDGSAELMQQTLVEALDTEDAAVDAWAAYCNEVQPWLPDQDVATLSALRDSRRREPLAFTVRDYEGVMPEVENLHQAFAASFFRNRCSLTLPRPEWADREL